MVTLTSYMLDTQWNFILRLVLDVMQVIINASLCLCLAFSHSLSLQERVVQAQTKFLCEDVENSTPKHQYATFIYAENTNTIKQQLAQWIRQKTQRR